MWSIGDDAHYPSGSWASCWLLQIAQSADAVSIPEINLEAMHTNNTDTQTHVPAQNSRQYKHQYRPVVPTFKLSTVGSRAFEVSGPCIWNELPKDVASAPLLTTFWCQLKTLLFQKSYPDIIIWHSSTGTAICPCSDVYHLGHSWTELNNKLQNKQKAKLVPTLANMVFPVPGGP